MGLEQFVINGETLTFFNIAEEMAFLRDVAFNFLSEYAVGFIAVIGAVWIGVFIMAILLVIKKRVVVFN